MNSDFLSDAMNEISDKHIVEAACYEPKVKVVSLKNILAAACIFAVAVSALFVYNHLQKPPSQPNDITTSDVETSDNGTTDGDTITQTNCPPLYSSWSEMPIYLATPAIVFEGRIYYSATLSDYAPVFDQSKIKDVLKEDKVLIYTGIHEKTVADVLICEIDGVDKENAVAVGRENGLNGGYCVYIERSLYNTDDFSTFLTSLNYKENLILSEHMFMYPQNNGDPQIWISYYKSGDGECDIIKCEDEEQKLLNEAFISMLENNIDKAECISDDSYDSEEYLSFEGYVCGYDFRVSFYEDGKLYFFSDTGVACYKLPQEEYKSFLALVQSTVDNF